MKWLNKKGKLSTGLATSIILVILGIVILFQVYAEIVPEAQDGGDLLGDEGRCGAEGYFWNSSDANCRLSNVTGTVVSEDAYAVPLGGLFESGGIAFTIIMAGLLIVAIIGILKNRK